MTRLSLHLVAMLAAALLVAGCGGGDDDETATPAAPAPVETTALTKDELLAQGDAICAEVNAAVGALASSESADGPANAAELYTGMVERLHDLGAPSDDAAGYSDLSAAAEELAQAQSDLELAVERGDAEGLAGAEAEASTALSSFQEAASDFGFEQCSEGPGALSASGAGDAPGGVEAEEEVAPEEVEGTEEEAPEEVEEAAPETGGAGSAEEGEAGGGAEAGGEAGGGGEGGGSSGGIGPG